MTTACGRNVTNILRSSTPNNVTCNDCIRIGRGKHKPKSKSCNACDDKGYVIESGTLMRCDICKQFTGDLDAAQAFFKLKASKDWALSQIIICYTKGRPI